MGMMFETGRLNDWARRHWFWPLLAVLITIEVGFARSIDWTEDRVAELAVVFDLCLFAPALYAFCYRKTLSLKPLLIRTAALALAGIYVAAYLVPEESQRLLKDLIWARYAGLAVIAAFELWIVVVTVRLVFDGAATKEIAEKSGAPIWVTRLMQLEARFWRALWRFLRGR